MARFFLFLDNLASSNQVADLLLNINFNVYSFQVFKKNTHLSNLAFPSEHYSIQYKFLY